MTAVIMLVPHEQGTKYIALVMHSNQQDRAKHEAMGFQEDWETGCD
ncbi:MAG: hypothetical protein KBA82_00485 [Nitrosomonas sp.]|nr:hypothetical protein [Nitrosomonas sp.]